MSTPLSFAGYATTRPPRDAERGHRWRLRAATAAAIAFVVALLAYGRDYYWLAAADRPFSDKHLLLKPSGSIGLKLGMLGLALFLVIFLYPVRKRWAWLSRQGSSRHWLDFHVVLGLTAPVVIALHASFKFRGIAGIAFWIMFAVALSGIVGRYIYAQIPRSLSSAEITLKDLLAEQEGLSAELAKQRLFQPAHLAPLFAMPTADEIGMMSAVEMIWDMFWLDLARPFHVARLRLRALGFGGALATGFGLFATSNHDLERIIAAARQRAALSKRIAFLERTRKVFHLWHVVHRPFSYSFAVLALLHIGAVISLGFF